MSSADNTFEEDGGAMTTKKDEETALGKSSIGNPEETQKNYRASPQAEPKSSFFSDEGGTIEDFPEASAPGRPVEDMDPDKFSGQEKRYFLETIPWSIADDFLNRVKREMNALMERKNIKSLIGIEEEEIFDSVTRIMEHAGKLPSLYHVQDMSKTFKENNNGKINDGIDESDIVWYESIPEMAKRKFSGPAYRTPDSHRIPLSEILRDYSGIFGPITISGNGRFYTKDNEELVHSTLKDGTFLMAGGGIMATKLPRFEGKSLEEIVDIVQKNDFTLMHNYAGNLDFKHKDGSRVLIHPYGGDSEFLTGTISHAHKNSSKRASLDDFGMRTTNEARRHIPIQKPLDYDQVRKSRGLTTNIGSTPYLPEKYVPRPSGAQTLSTPTSSAQLPRQGAGRGVFARIGELFKSRGGSGGGLPGAENDPSTTSPTMRKKMQ